MKRPLRALGAFARHLPLVRDTEVIALDRRHAAAAAQLCAQALLRRRALDERFPDTQGVEPVLQLAWERRLADPYSTGFGLVIRGRLAGVLAVTYQRLPPGSSERIYSPLASGWVPQSLCAVAEVLSPADALPTLYEVAADWLTRRGVSIHLATVAAADAALLAAWRLLGFRAQGAFALLTDEGRRRLGLRVPPAGVAVRMACLDDAPAIVALLAESHRYHAALPGSFFDAEDGDRHYPTLVESELHDPSGEPRYLLALEGRRIIGLASGYVETAAPQELAVYTRPLPLGYVAEVAVTAEARGRGIAGALLAALLPWLEEGGVSRIGLHFIASNPTASRAWPALGFSPLEIRLQGGPDPSSAALPVELVQ